MTAFVLRIFGITAAMTAVIVVLMLLSRIAGGKFTAKCRYVVWAVVMLRLAIPLGMGEGWLMQIELPAEQSAVAEEDTADASATPTVQPEIVPSPTEPSFISREQLSEPEYTTENTVPSWFAQGEQFEESVADEPITEKPAAEEPVEDSVPTSEPVTLQDILGIAGIVYAVCAAAYFVIRLVLHGVYTKQVSRWKKRVAPEMYGEYRSICESMRIRRAPALYSSAKADSPMLYGYFRPQIVLPASVTDAEKVRGILAHELTHYRRGDLWVKLVCLTAESLHWFNPLVHIASRRCEQEMELACDESVLDGMDEEARVDYGYAMLDIVKQCRNRTGTLTTQYSPKKSAVKERFDNILDMRRKRRGVLIIALAVILCAAAGLAISCTVETDEEAASVSESEDEAEPDAILEKESAYIEEYNKKKKEEEILNLQFELEVQNRQIEELKAQLDEVQSERRSIEDTLQSLRAELKLLEEELTAADNKNSDALTAQLADTEKKIEAYEAQLADSFEKSGAIIEQMTAAEERANAILAEMNGGSLIAQRGNIYLCDDVYITDDTAAHGEYVILLPDTLSENFKINTAKVILCDDGCDPQSVVSRMFWGYAPVYTISEYVEHTDWNYPTRQYLNKIPEDEKKNFSESDLYYFDEIRRAYLYLITLGDGNTAFIVLEPAEESPDKPENEEELADDLIKNVRIVIDGEEIPSFSSASATTAFNYADMTEMLASLESRLEAVRASSDKTEQKQEQTAAACEELKNLYTGIENRRSNLLTMMDEYAAIKMQIEAGDAEAYTDIYRTYDTAAQGLEQAQAEYTQLMETRDTLLAEYENWLGYRYELEAQLYTIEDSAALEEITESYMNGEMPMHIAMQHRAVREHTAEVVNEALAAVTAGDFNADIFETAEVSSLILPYDARMPEKFTANTVYSLFDEFTPDSTMPYRLVVPVSSSADIVFGFDLTEYKGRSGIFITDVFMEYHSMTTDAQTSAEKHAKISGMTPNAYASDDTTVRTNFVSYYTDDKEAVLYFTLDNENFFEAKVEIPEEYEYDTVNVVELSYENKNMETIVEICADGVYTYLVYRDMGELFDGVLSAQDFRREAMENAWIPDYIRFPCTNYPNMTDDINHTAVLGLSSDMEACLQKAEELLRDIDTYYIWNDGTALHLIARDFTGYSYKMIRTDEDGEVIVLNGSSNHRTLWNQAVFAGIPAVIYQTARALITPDTAYLEDILGLPEGEGKMFDSLKITSAYLHIPEDGSPYERAAMEVSVAASEIDRFPVGEYTLIISNDYDGLVITREGENFAMSPEPESDAQNMIYSWLRVTGMELIPLGETGMETVPIEEELTAEEIAALSRAATEFASFYADGTIESIRAALEWLFWDGKDLFTDEILYSGDGVHYGAGGHGAARFTYDWRDEFKQGDGTTIIRVQFYADVNKLVPAMVIEYTLRSVDSDIEGIGYAFEDCTILENDGHKLYAKWT